MMVSRSEVGNRLACMHGVMRRTNGSAIVIVSNPQDGRDLLLRDERHEACIRTGRYRRLMLMRFTLGSTWLEAAPDPANHAFPHAIPPHAIETVAIALANGLHPDASQSNPFCPATPINRKQQGSKHGPCRHKSLPGTWTTPWRSGIRGIMPWNPPH
jgi:hypothetical protein